MQERFLREKVAAVRRGKPRDPRSHGVRGIGREKPHTPVHPRNTGTGKELVATAIDYRSPNFRGPLVSVNCAAIPKELLESELFGYEKGAFTGASFAGKKGLVEEASGGTLFLDEVADLSPEAQAKLLRFLEDGEFYRVGGTRRLRASARVVSATNKELEILVGKGLFREDLYYRLAVVRVAVPALSERRDDILPIARHFLAEFSRKFGRAVIGFSTEAEGALLAYPWEGNIRELRNVVERAILSGKGKESSPPICGWARRVLASAFRLPPALPGLSSHRMGSTCPRCRSRSRSAISKKPFGWRRGKRRRRRSSSASITTLSATEGRGWGFRSLPKSDGESSGFLIFRRKFFDFSVSLPRFSERFIHVSSLKI